MIGVGFDQPLKFNGGGVQLAAGLQRLGEIVARLGETAVARQRALVGERGLVMFVLGQPDVAEVVGRDGVGPVGAGAEVVEPRGFVQVSSRLGECGGLEQVVEGRVAFIEREQPLSPVRPSRPDRDICQAIPRPGVSGCS